MLTAETKKSLLHALSSIKSWAAVLGILASSVALCNFLSTLLSVHLSAALATLLTTYKLLVHGAIDWILFPLGIKLPQWIKDAIFIYCIVGGAFMRARMREDVYADPPKDASLLKSLKIVSKRVIVINGGIPMTGRMSVFYQVSPKWVRRVMDAVLWPRVARQYFARPMVHQNDYLGTFPSFPAGYKPGSYKVFLYDRRHVFYFQLAAAFAAVIFILVVNGFLSVP
ncbi:hypothetical protein [Paraburkholderia aspalathi]|uniref:hypothetical protein n=1 Tax=Paraburkholderia aspalathi TaxID=1324617 RepID=UPI00190C9A8A|nr:hypothetical protein [Paraburkholderia aspalathi]MBK3842912.1 hypothetical protein [Paraburkholderia aspalathi]